MHSSGFSEPVAGILSDLRVVKFRKRSHHVAQKLAGGGVLSGLIDTGHLETELLQLVEYVQKLTEIPC